MAGKERVFGYKAGDVYEYLTLTGKSYCKAYERCTVRYVECICICGKIFFTLFSKVKRGGTKSCGCKRMSFIIKGNTKHGMTLNGIVHPIYKAWQQMKERCKGTREKENRDYTQRGIIVCEEWKDFNIFNKWAIENGWAEGLSLDRENNDGNYEPKNCRWVTIPVQNRNTRRNIFVEAFGEKKCVTDWANSEKCSVKASTITYRIKKLGWHPEDAIQKPRTNSGKS